MDINSILNQVLGAGQKMGGGNTGGLGNVLGSALGGGRGAGGNSLGALLQNSDQLKKLGAGAAAAGVLSMLLGGSRSTRNAAGSLAKMGSLAAMGTLAYKAYQNWQSTNSGSVQRSAAQAAPNIDVPPLLPSAERNAVEQENNSRVVLKAMIAAANADGEIDAGEQTAILQQIGAEDSEAQAWVRQIITNTPSVAQLAAEVGNDQGLAAEVYLASRIVCGDLDRKEIVYLSQLQQALGLRDSFVEMLEKQAGF